MPKYIYILVSNNRIYLSAKNEQLLSVGPDVFKYLGISLIYIRHLTFGSLDVNAVGSRTRWIGNLSTTSLFS